MTKFEKLSKEDKEKFLAQRKQESAEHYREMKERNEAIRLKRKAFKSKVHEGNKFLLDERKRIDEEKGGTNYISNVFNLGPFEITFGVLPISWDCETIICKASYCIKSPGDKYNPRVGTGLIGKRLKEQKEWCLITELPRDMYEYEYGVYVDNMIRAIITSRILSRADEVPQRVINTLFGTSIKEWKNRTSQKCQPCNEPNCTDCNP